MRGAGSSTSSARSGTADGVGGATTGAGFLPFTGGGRRRRRAAARAAGCADPRAGGSRPSSARSGTTGACRQLRRAASAHAARRGSEQRQPRPAVCDKHFTRHARNSILFSSSPPSTRSRIDVDADAGPCRHGDRAVGADDDLRIDQVGRVVAAARGDVARQREIRQRRQVDVVGAADAALEHAAVPDRDAVRRAQRSWSRIDCGVAADPARLDVDDPAGAQRDAPLPPARTQWIDSSRQIVGSHPPLQPRVIAHVIVVERLLDHHQVEAVEPGQMRGVARACRRRWRRPSAGWRRTRPRIARRPRRPSPA